MFNWTIVSAALAAVIILAALITAQYNYIFLGGSAVCFGLSCDLELYLRRREYDRL